MNKPRRKHPSRSRIHPYLSSALRHRLDEYCAKRGIHESALVEQAIAQLLDGTSAVSLLYRRLDSVSRRFDQLLQALELQGELLNEFLKIWLRNTPPLPDPDAQSTVRQARLRYQRILERIAARVSSGKTFVDELPKESLLPVADDASTPAE